MPDQPDDAHKRQQRGVLPPFFAPRSGRGEGSPAHVSGAWRRVSRLFTPPGVARQRGALARPQTPFTPPSTPVTEPSEVVAEAGTGDVEQLPMAGPLVTPDSSPVSTNFPFDIAESAEARTLDDIAWPTPAYSDVVQPDPFGGGDPAGFDRPAGDDLVVESLEPEPISLAMTDVAAADAVVGSGAWAIERSALDDFDPRDKHDERTSLDDSWEGADVAAAEREGDYAAWTEPAAPATDEGADVAAAQGEEGYTAWAEPAAPVTDEGAVEEAPVAVHDEVVDPSLDVGSNPSVDTPSVTWHSYERPSPVSEPEGRDDSQPVAHESIAPVSDAPAMPHDVAPTSIAPVASDPWVDVDLPEPAFGSSGWMGADSVVGAGADWPAVSPDSGLASPSADDYARGEVDAGTVDPSGTTGEGEKLETADEMSAALAWNEMDAGRDAEAAVGELDVAAHSANDTFSAVANELRDTSSPWGSVDAAGAEYGLDASERAGTGEYGHGAWAGGEAAREARRDSRSASEDAPPIGAEGGAGAAIADALARVADRIRAGEVELSAETAGASDESALAAVLAALLRGPRR